MIYLHTGTTEIPEMVARLPTNGLDLDVQKLLWIAMFASFAVKVPMWPFHTWLPDAHVEAPTAGSVLLAGVLSSSAATASCASRCRCCRRPRSTSPFIFTLSIVAIVYTSLVALMQNDMKKLIAYSSVAHMGIVTIGLFTPNALGIEGGIVTMLSHGFVSAALFMVVGVVYDRIHSREIDAYGGLAEVMPVYATVFMLFMLASVGLPGTSGFIGEILVIVGVFQVSSWVAFFAATGMILGAAYMLWLYRRVIFGELLKDTLKGIRDLRTNEVIAFAPSDRPGDRHGRLSSLFLDPMHASVNQLSGADRDRGHRSRPALSAETSREPRPTPAASELVLFVGALAFLLLGAIRGEQDGARLLTPLAVLTMLVAALIAAAHDKTRVLAFDGHFVFDGYAAFLKVLILVGASGALLLAGSSCATRRSSATSTRCSSCSRHSA